MTDDATRQVDQPKAESTAGAATGATPVDGVPTTTPVVAASAGSASRARWAIGLGVAGVVIAATIGAVMLLGARPTPEALRYLPGDTAMVLEIRMDLPGDQLQKLGNLLAHFPGFQDQSTLPEKIDEALSRLVETESAELDYQTDIKPWLAGPAFIGVSVPDDLGEPAGDHAPLVSATTNGGVDCATVIDGAVTHETYRGLDIVTGAEGKLSCVIDGRQALLGDPAAIRAGLDAKADGTGIDRSARYGAARAALTGDQLGSIYVDGAAIEGALPDPSLPAALSGLAALQDLAGPVPAWTIVGLRAEDDAIVMDTIAATEPADPATAGSAATQAPLALPPTHPSVLTGMLPAETILLVEHQGTGVALQNLLTRLDSVPELAPALGMLDGVGGGDQLVGWIDDAGIAVLGGSTPSGGLLLVARDEAAATERVVTIRNLLTFAGAGGGLEVTETTVAGVAVTTVAITDPGAFIPPGSIPGGVPSMDAPIQFSFAAKGKVILVGVGEGFMTTVLNVQAGASLADQARYRATLGRGLANSRASVFVSVPAAIDLVEGFVPAEELSQWQTDYVPYVEPFEVVSMTSSEDESTRRSRLVVTVSQP